MKKVFINGYGSIGSRITSFLKDDPEITVIGIGKYSPDEKVNVAISAHGNSMRPFRKYFEKLTIKQMMKLENLWDTLSNIKL